RRAVQEKENAKSEAVERADLIHSALQIEVKKNREAARGRDRELADLKKQVVRTSRSLALSEAERIAERNSLYSKIDKLNEEARRLGVQTEASKNLAARTVTRVSNGAFLNASQASKALAPKG
ncbi:unnamed protein product, partial [Pylaiella littoralis]